MALDSKGRCCGRKPIVYKRDKHLFCCRCNRSFNMNGSQISNWAWIKSPNGDFINVETKPIEKGPTE